MISKGMRAIRAAWACGRAGGWLGRGEGSASALTALPRSIAPCWRCMRLSIQKLIDAVSPVGTVTIDMGVLESYEISCTDSAHGTNSCFLRST